MKKYIAQKLMTLALYIDRIAWRLLETPKKWGEPIEYRYKITGLNEYGEEVPITVEPIRSS